MLDVYTGKLSWRRLGVILRQLPMESRYHTELRDNPADEDQEAEEVDSRHGPWSLVNYQLASAIDAVNHLAFMWSDGKSKPEPTARPGMDAVADVTPLNDLSAAYLQYIRDHHGAAPPPGWTPETA